MSTQSMSLGMKRMRGWLMAAAVMLGGLWSPAQAEVITETLYQSTTLVTGSSMSIAVLNLDTPGKLTVSLTDLEWPSDLLACLSFTLTDAKSVLGIGSGSGSWDFEIESATTLYAIFYAAPSAIAKAGMYYADVSYTSVAPVPLPAAFWFLVSGIAGLFAMRPKQNTSAVKLSQIPA